MGKLFPAADSWSMSPKTPAELEIGVLSESIGSSGGSQTQLFLNLLFTPLFASTSPHRSFLTDACTNAGVQKQSRFVLTYQYFSSC